MTHREYCAEIVMQKGLGNTAQMQQTKVERKGDVKSEKSPWQLAPKAHCVRLPNENVCQPEAGSPERTSYSVWRSVFADLGIAFVDTPVVP